MAYIHNCYTAHIQ